MSANSEWYFLLVTFVLQRFKLRKNVSNGLPHSKIDDSLFRPEDINRDQGAIVISRFRGKKFSFVLGIETAPLPFI